MELLSPEWCERLTSLGASDAGDGPDVVVGLQFGGAPRGLGRVTLTFVAGCLTGCSLGKPTAPDLALKTTWDDACAMLRDELDPQVAFMRGDLKTDGPTSMTMWLLAAWDRPGVVAVRRELIAGSEWPD